MEFWATINTREVEPEHGDPGVSALPRHGAGSLRSRPRGEEERPLGYSRPHSHELETMYRKDSSPLSLYVRASEELCSGAVLSRLSALSSTESA